MSELPKGWTFSNIGECFSEIKNGTTLTQNTSVKGVPVSRIETIQNNKFDLNRIRHVEKISEEVLEVYRYKIGDIALSHINSYEHVGKTALYDGKPEKFIHGMNLLRLRFGHDFIYPKFAQLFMQTNFFREEVRKRVGHAVNQVSINQKNLSEVPFIVAPLNEQRRIVEKLEKILGRVEAARERLERVPLILKRFRQSVLAAACSGKLTADWRGKEEQENKLPIGWQWMEVDKLLPKGGIFDGPFGSNLKTSDYTASGVRVIRLENIGHLNFISEKKSFISEEKYQTLIKHTVGEGDVIFASFIADEIRGCVLPKLETKAIAKADCFCLRPNNKLIDKKYFIFQLVSRESYNLLVDNVHGATRPRINTTQLRKHEKRICSLTEQQEIVRRVEELFALADTIEERYRKAKRHFDKLTQSVLAKAFRGELVPQDPNDEPASFLLERIKQERANNEKPKQEKKRTPSLPFR